MRRSLWKRESRYEYCFALASILNAVSSERKAEDRETEEDRNDDATHLPQDLMHKRNIVDVSLGRNLDALEELIDLLVREFLTQRGEDVFELALADEAVAVLVKDLEPANELVCGGRGGVRGGREGRWGCRVGRAAVNGRRTRGE